MRVLKILSLFVMLFCLFPVIGSSQDFYQGVVKPMDVREYDLTYDGIVGTGTYTYKNLTTGSLGTLFRDNEDDGLISGCNGEGCGGHSGVDIPCPVGIPVYSIASGKVIRSESNPSWGELIVIEHNTSDIPGIDESVYSCYAHLNARNVYLDNQVSKGQLIGETGNTGNSTGPHLHFQIDRKYQFGTTTEFTSPYWPRNYPPYRTVDEIDVDHTVDSYTYNPMPFLKYKSLVPVGFYSDGWHTNGTSQAFRDTYDSHAPTIGFPFKNGNEGVAHIHYWSITNDPNNDDGVWVQDFRRDTNQPHFGTDGQTAIILNTSSNIAYLIKEGFWGWYKENHGYSNLDYPLGEEFVDQGLTIQRFKNKYLEYNSSNGEINPREYTGGSGSTTLGGAMIPTHQVTINSIPQGAEIWNAGTSLGTAPVVDYYYEDYTYYMTAKLTGYDDKDFQFTVGNSDMTIEVNLGSGGGSANPGDPLVSLLAASPSPTYAGQNWQVQFELTAQDDPVVNDTIKVYRSEPNFVNATMMQEWTDVNISANNSQIFSTQTETAPAVGTYELTVKIKRDTGTEELLVGTGSTTNPDLAYIEEENSGNGIVKAGEFYPADTVVVVDSTYEFSVQLVEVTGTSSIQISDLRLSLHDTSGTVLYDLGTWYNISIAADGSWTRQDEFVFPDIGQYKLGVRYSNDGTNWTYPATFLYQVTNPGPPNPKNIFVNDSIYNPPIDFTTNLISYWELDEDSGIRIDSHGDNDLVDNNTVGYGTGKQGDGADFEKSNNEYLSILDANQTGLDLADDFSLACWVNFESLPSVGDGMMMMTKDDWSSSSTRAFKFSLENHSGTLNLELKKGYSGSAESELTSWTPTLGTYYLLVVTRDGTSGDVKFYIDGSQYGSTHSGSTNALQNTSSPFAIGAHFSSTTVYSFFDGIIDEVGIWSRVLSAQEVTDLYNDGDGIPYSSSSPLNKRGNGGEEVIVNDKNTIPNNFVLHQNYPNPFNPTTTIRYNLPEDVNVNISVYNIVGKKVATLVNDKQEVGYKTVIWNGKDQSGSQTVTGVYFYRIQAGQFIQTKKMILIK